MNSKCVFVTPPCCARPSIARMDHLRGMDGDPMVNRACLHCGRHWYGNDGTNVVEFTRAAWERWMNAPMEDVA